MRPRQLCGRQRSFRCLLPVRCSFRKLAIVLCTAGLIISLVSILSSYRQTLYFHAVHAYDVLAEIANASYLEKYKLCDMKNEHNSTINSLKCPLTREEINELSGNFNGGVIVMTYGNNAWVSFIENWLCFAKKARLRTLVLAMNETICQRIEKFKTSGILCKSAAEMTSSLIANSTYGKSSWWGSPNYKLMMRHKMAGLYSVLQCRRPVLLSDADAIIARNPVPYLLNLTSNTHPSYDMVFAKDSTGWNKIDQLGFAGRLGRFYVCAGLGLYFPTNHTFNFLRTVISYQEKYWNDQEAINICLRHHNADVTWTTLDARLFPNGEILAKNYSVYFDGLEAKMFEPFVYHMNWVKGEIGKIYFLKKYGAWSNSSVKDCGYSDGYRNT